MQTNLFTSDVPWDVARVPRKMLEHPLAILYSQRLNIRRVWLFESPPVGTLCCGKDSGLKSCENGSFYRIQWDRVARIKSVIDDVELYRHPLFEVPEFFIIPGSDRFEIMTVYQIMTVYHMGQYTTTCLDPMYFTDRQRAETFCQNYLC